MTTHTARMGFAGFKLLFHSVCMHHIILQWKTLIYRFTSSYNERPLSIETNISTHLYWTPNATLWTICNISFVVQTIPTKLGICVYNHICNKMASANKVNFQKYFW